MKVVLFIELCSISSKYRLEVRLIAESTNHIKVALTGVVLDRMVSVSNIE